MRDYRKYDVWKLGHEITLEVYKLTKSFPKEEKYGLINQMRIAAYSIPSNIAEGCGRESDQEFKRYLTMARASASELEYFTFLVKDLGYLKEDNYSTVFNKVNKVRRSINNLIDRI